MLCSIIFWLMILGYMVQQGFQLGKISGNGKGVQKLDAFLIENENNLLDDMN
jgi:hypothetical protein